MGDTFIRRFENRSRSTITLISKKDAGSPGHNIAVPTGSRIAVNMLIPHANNQTDFANNHLEVVVGGVTRYWIWQAANADGEFIRFSTDGAWHDQGERAHGYAGVATNLFEALAGFFTNDAEPFAQLFLGDRALVVLDSHFETIPISGKPPLPYLPVTVVKQLENRTSSTVTIRSEETGQTVTAAPNSIVQLNINVPWVHPLNPFASHHLKVMVGGVTRFWIWQHENRNDGDYVRFSTNGIWTELATRVNGFAETGISPTDLVFTGDRSIIVTNTGFELMPNPLLIDGLLDVANMFVKRAKRFSETPMLPAPTSVPKRSAVAFSVPGPVADAFNRGEPNTRFLYNESGKRYEFTLGTDGKVSATHPNGTNTILDKAYSYRNSRAGQSITPPPFDLIAANGSRVFAKAKDADDFYFLTMDEHYIHKSKNTPENDPEITIPSTYFKLDPEFGFKTDTSELLLTTNGVRTDHPASERFPMFRKVLSKQPTDMMIAKLTPREWQQLDCRPPQNAVPFAISELLKDTTPLVAEVSRRFPALGPLLLIAQLAYYIGFKQDLQDKLTLEVLENWSAPPPLLDAEGRPTDTGVPWHTPITYERPDTTKFSPPAIKFQRVLDIGISHVYHHQQYPRTTGGEIQPMLLVDFYRSVYRFFNGAVQDGDGYIDGTSNLYALVKHDTTPASYSILFQDEQLYFSQRWRRVGPDDTKGIMFSLAADLAQPAYQWDPRKYWNPFKNGSGYINDNSRLAVSAHVLLVTGQDPAAANAWRIFSTNFSWGTMDRSWRWRKMPTENVELFSPAAVTAGDETIPAATRENVYPQTIRLRDDLTMHLKGTRNVGGQWVAGRWYQRYLPADNSHVPPANELLIGNQMPTRFYQHNWKFLPERTFRLADNFKFMGVYDTVDSRSQYYEVTPATATDAQKLELNSGPWFDDTRQLYCSQWKFRWHDTRLPGADPLDEPSLFNSDTRFRIVRKGSRLIATFADKRDDDMMPFERLPRLVTLKRKTTTGAFETVQVTIGANKQLLDPPVVQNAYFWLEANGTAGIAFESRDATVNSLRENIARVRMASLEADPLDQKRVARVNQLFDKITEGNFNLVGPGVFEFRWTPTASELTLLQQHATPNGETQFGTSIWFEDVAGNVAVAEQLLWQRSGTAKAMVTPAMIPLGVPTQVSVRAEDGRTGVPLTGGIVMVNGQQVGTTDAPFTFTFNVRIEREWEGDMDPPQWVETRFDPLLSVKVPGCPEAFPNVQYFKPSMSVRMEPAAVPIGPATQVIVRAEDTTTRTPVNGRVFIGGMELAATNQPFTFAFGSNHGTGGVAAVGYPDKSFVTGIYVPQMQVSVSPSPIWMGRPVEVIVRAVDTRTGALVNGRVKLNGVDVGATNTPFIFTFGFTAPVGVVSAPFYAEVAIVWPPLSKSTMFTSITPLPPPNKTVQTTILATNQQTGAPVAGRVKINGVDVGPTNTVISTIFKIKFVGAELEPVGPKVEVTADGYTTAPVDIGF